MRLGGIIACGATAVGLAGVALVAPAGVANSATGAAGVAATCACAGLVWRASARRRERELAALARSLDDSAAGGARVEPATGPEAPLVASFNRIADQAADERVAAARREEQLTENARRSHARLASIRRKEEADLAHRQQREGEYYQKTRSQIIEAHSEVKLILESIPSVLIGVGRDGRVTQWNAAAERTFALRAADVVGKPFAECGIKWDWKQILAYQKQDSNLASYTHIDDVAFQRPDGKQGFLSVSLAWLAGTATTASSLLVFIVDITERKHLELQSVQSMKLEAIGQLAAGIAHEINTPTQYVGDNLRFLDDGFRALSEMLARYREALAGVGDKVPLELAHAIEVAAERVDLAYVLEEVPKSIAQAVDGVERISTIVQAMKEFSHPEPGTRKLANLNRALENTINVARNEWKYVAEVETRLDPSLPAVPCNPGELNQVFLNIVINAAHAIAAVGKGAGAAGSQPLGRITVATRRDGEWVEVAVADTGTGIPEAARARVFDPFFTTKEVGKGTGQGLYIARDIVVKRHGGTIDFVTELGRGTTFRIRLPVAAGARLAKDPSAAFAILTSRPDPATPS
jgi:PAS domain S-box-containing protein